MNDIYKLLLELCKDEIEEYKELVEFDPHLDFIEEDIEDMLYHFYNINIDEFEQLIEKLLPLCEKDKSPLTEILYRSFATDNHWLIKKKVDA